MIVLESELQVSLGLTDPDDLQRARLALAMTTGHAAVRKYLGYDPEQRSGPAELYPRTDQQSENADGVWDVNPSHTRATFEQRRGISTYLQLSRLPVRSVTQVLVDPSAKFGQQSGDFGSGTEWTQGVEFAVEWDEVQSANVGICRSGILVAVGAWPAGIGTVKVTYRAGFSQNEFRGPSTASSVAADGTITTQGVDASGIKAAALLTCMAKYHTLKAFAPSQLTGLHPTGPMSSERLGDYSYSAANPQLTALIAGMAVDVPPEAASLLQDHINYGVLVL